MSSVSSSRSSQILEEPAELEQITSYVDKLVGKYGKNRNSLMQILHKLEENYHEIPSHAMQVLADKLGMHAIEVQDTASFFHFYNTNNIDIKGNNGIKNKSRFIIYVCKNMPCEMQDARTLVSCLEKELGIKFGETTKDGMFSLEWTNCIGMCDQGPAMLINDVPYTRVKPEEIRSIIQRCREV
jgi:NADH:ubiquinone oxidoreductase subunit E